jgi:hypothetical protein
MVTRAADGAKPKLTCDACGGTSPKVTLRSMASAEKRYSAQQVREILRRAQTDEKGRAVGSDEPGLTAAELLDNAKDLGFSTRDVHGALLAYEEDQKLVVAEQELRQLSYRSLSTHAVVYLSVLGALMFFGVLALSAKPLGAVMLVWGMMLLLKLRGVLFPDPDKLRESAKQRLVSQQLKQSGKQLGSALATGAAKLMALSAQKIDQGVKQLDK